MKTLIEVTADDIKHGAKNTCLNCPVTRAINRHIDTTRFIASVGLLSFSIYIIKSKRWLMTLNTTTECFKFISSFDDSRPVEPFSFEVDFDFTPYATAK